MGIPKIARTSLQSLIRLACINTKYYLIMIVFEL